MRIHEVSSVRVSESLQGQIYGGFVGFERPPLFADSFDLLVLCYSQQCSTLSAGVPVQFGYYRSVLHIHPPFATLELVENVGGGLYAGSDILSREYDPSSGATPRC